MSDVGVLGLGAQWVLCCLNDDVGVLGLGAQWVLCD
jgi:hypothetical protein